MIYLIFAIILIAPMVAAGACFTKKRGFAETLVLSALLCVFGILLLIAWLNKTYPGGAIALITNASQELVRYIKEPFDSTGVNLLNEMVDKELAELNLLLPTIFLFQFPSMVITIVVFYCYIVMRLIRRVRKWFKKDTESMKSFSAFKASRGTCNAMLLILLLTIFGSNSILDQILRNIYSLAYTAIGICGFSYVDSAFRRAIPQNTIRMLIYFIALAVIAATPLLLLLPLAFSGMAFVGIFDAFRDFRGLDKPIDGGM